MDFSFQAYARMNPSPSRRMLRCARLPTAPSVSIIRGMVGFWLHPGLRACSDALWSSKIERWVRQGFSQVTRSLFAAVSALPCGLSKYAAHGCAYSLSRANTDEAFFVEIMADCFCRAHPYARSVRPTPHINSDERRCRHAGFVLE